MGELRPLLKQYTVYPKFVDNPGIEHGGCLLLGAGGCFTKGREQSAAVEPLLS